MGRPQYNNNKKGSASSTSARSSPYAAAATLLSQIIEEKKSFKKLVYAKDGTLKCSKTTYAQVCQVLSYSTILDQILEQVPKLKKDVRNAGLLHVLVYELLFGPNKKIKGGGAVKRNIVQHEQALQKALETKTIAKQLEQFENHRQHLFPRYARVNTLLTTSEDVCSSLLAEGKKEDKEDKDSAGTSASLLEFYMDPHVPDLLVLPPSILAYVMAPTDSSKQQDPLTAIQRQQNIIKNLIQSGKLILQDKSSCFSALCLARGYDDASRRDNEDTSKRDYMDACAAPGNKTQHLATLIASKLTEKKNPKAKSKVDTPTVYAMDRSAERLKSLSERMKELVPTSDTISVSTTEADFLQTQHDHFKSVGGILLDPSCSGSGIYTAPDRWSESIGEDGDNERIEPLANFQEMALRHAMSFPSVSRIVYSTCSLHERENEVVALGALTQMNATALEEETGYQWHIVAPKCMRHWKRRGHVIEGLCSEDAECMIRANNEDETNGFFVCCFEKRKVEVDEVSKKGKEKSSSKQMTPPIPKGVAVYKGQFAKKNQVSKPSQASEPTIKPVTPPKTTTKPAKMAEKSPKKNAKVEAQNSKKSKLKKGETGESRIEDEQKLQDKKKRPRKPLSEQAASKKRDKKMAWRKRQMEEKQERLQKKLKTAAAQEV